MCVELMKLMKFVLYICGMIPVTTAMVYDVCACIYVCMCMRVEVMDSMYEKPRVMGHFLYFYITYS